MKDPRIDDLRQQLRSLGYLDAGVNRFVLGPAQERRGPTALAARFAMRVALLGGVLLGPAAAIGVGSRLPGLVSGIRDAMVIAVYLAVIFFLAVSVLSFLVSLVATAVRRPFIPRAAGSIVTVATLLYLTLWWRNANAGFGWSAPVWTAFALLVAVAISLLLGHAQRIATIAVLAAGARRSAALPPIAFRSWRVVLGVGALAFAGAAALLILTTAEAPVAISHPPLTVVSGMRVRLIAIDGFDADLYSSPGGVPPGEPPVSNRGLWNTRVRLAPHDTSDPARAWTTIATGEPPDVHGVQRLETRRLAGIQGILSAGDSAAWSAIRAATDVARLTRPSIASREERQAKTIWEVAEDAGLRTAVVNWWATWPAPTGQGIVITDRAVLRLEHGGPLDAEISPADLYPALQRQWPEIRARARETAAASFGSVTDPRALSILRRSAELDATILGIAQALPGPARDLDVIYLPGLDIAQHTLLGTSEGGAPSPSLMADRVDALKRYYSFLVRIIDPLLDHTKLRDATGRTAGTMVMVVTGPGRVQGPAPGIIGVVHPEGFIDARQDATARVVDVAPSVLFALGIPLSRELAGAPIRTLFLGSQFDDRRLRSVDTYGRPLTPPMFREGKPLDQEVIDRLRSLGYVK